MRCQHKLGRLRVIGFGWEKTPAGRWKKYLVRRCLECREPQVVRVWIVYPEYPFCMLCLSQNVKWLSESERGEEYQCLSCNTTFRLV